jgi:2-dehydropantoate 2-reductase
MSTVSLMSHTRFVVVGAGAIGGVVGARLVQGGHDVLLVARGAHGEAIAERGLTIEDPAGSATLRIPVVSDASEVDYRDGDITLLCVKTQDTVGALASIRRGGGAAVPIACLQNGVANEPMALRVSPSVYGVAVMCPGEHLTPGVVAAYSAPKTGILDLGRYPAGPPDDAVETVAAALRDAEFLSEIVPDIMRAKYSKLLMNLGNAIEVVCGPGNDGGLFEMAHHEGKEILAAAGIGFDDEVDPRRDQMRMHRAAGRRREGGSTWQSVHRGLGTVETDYLSGEIVLTARRLGLDAPVNRVLQELSARVAAGEVAPGSLAPEYVISRMLR